MTYAIVVAAGSGERLGAGVPKALVELAGAPLVAWCLRALAATPGIAGIVIAAPADHLDDIRAVVPAGGPPVEVVPGGSTRQRSVAAALAAVPASAAAVLVHDAARPLTTAAVFADVAAAIDGAVGAIAAAPVADTLKRAGGDGCIDVTVDRAGLWAAQTPQGFRADVLRRVVGEADAATLDAATDCASMVEAAGGRVRLVAVHAPNIKVTTPADLAVAEAILHARAAARR